MDLSSRFFDFIMKHQMKIFLFGVNALFFLDDFSAWPSFMKIFVLAVFNFIFSVFYIFYSIRKKSLKISSLPSHQHFLKSIKSCGLPKAEFREWQETNEAHFVDCFFKKMNVVGRILVQGSYKSGKEKQTLVCRDLEEGLRTKKNYIYYYYLLSFSVVFYFTFY